MRGVAKAWTCLLKMVGLFSKTGVLGGGTEEWQNITMTTVKYILWAEMLASKEKEGGYHMEGEAAWFFNRGQASGSEEQEGMYGPRMHMEGGGTERTEGRHERVEFELWKCPPLRRELLRHAQRVLHMWNAASLKRSMRTRKVDSALLAARRSSIAQI